MKNLNTKDESTSEDVKFDIDDYSEGSCEIEASLELDDKQLEDAFDFTIFSKKYLFIFSILFIVGMVFLFLIISH